jgi:hypothetical protein
LIRQNATSAGCLGKIPLKTFAQKSFRKLPALLADMAAGNRYREEGFSISVIDAIVCLPLIVF